jgi:MFS family permease
MQHTVAVFSTLQGLYNEVVGPTLPDLKERIGCNYEEIGRALSARSAGLFLGSIVGGFVYDRWLWRRDLFIALALLLSAGTITLAPWCKTLWQLGIVFHLMGHSHGLLTTGQWG